MGQHPAGGSDDIFALAESVDRTLLPALRFDCGTEDFLLGHNRALHDHLTTLSLPHEYIEHPGDHNWVYWNKYVLDTLTFFCQVLGIEGFKAEGQ